MKTEINPNEYYDAQEAASILEMGSSSIYKHYRSPKKPNGLRFSEIGKKRYTKGSWILEYIENRERKF